MMSDDPIQTTPSHWLGVLIGVLLPFFAMGAESRPAAEMPLVATVRGGYLGPADFDRGGQVALAEGEISWEYPLNPTTGTLGRLNFQVGAVEVDTQGAVGPLTDAELDPLLNTAVGYFLAIPVAGGWSGFFRGGMMASGESQAEAEDSLLYNAMGGAEYAVSRAFSIQMGVMGTTRLEEEPRVIPLVGFRWRPAPDWLIATEGAGVKINGPLRSDLQFTIHAGWMTQAWRLDDEDPAPDGILETEAFRMDTGLRWDSGRGFKWEAGLGWEPSRKYRLLDADGHDAGILTAEAAPLARVSGTYRF